MYCITNRFELYLQLQGQLSFYSSHFQERLLLLKGNRNIFTAMDHWKVTDNTHMDSHHVFLFLVLQS